jgi:hypothetical protein
MKKTCANLILIFLSSYPNLSYAQTTDNNSASVKAQVEMREMRRLVVDYVREKNVLPQKTSDILDQAAILYRKEGKLYKDFLEQMASKKQGSSSFIVPYFIKTRRLSGVPYFTPKSKGSRDVILYTDKFFSANGKTANPMGFYTVLWDDMSIDLIPYDCLFYSIRLTEDPQTYFRSKGFMGEGGLLDNTLSYEEFWVNAKYKYPPIGKKSDKVDNFPTTDNGIDSLVILSRYLSNESRYGIDRDDLWSTFDSKKTEFSLNEVELGAKRLKIPVQVVKSSLSELDNKKTVASLFLKDDGRIVTLTALDDDRAVVVDRGLTRNVERSVLEKRYSGEALVPTKALTQKANIVADDAVRQVQLKTLEEEVLQSVTFRNTGKTAVKLELEYPLLGVTESKLSKDSLAPGETATLDLKIKWRSILKVPTQNVLVSLQTSDPIVPRLQLAFLLVPPTAPQ